MDTKRCSKCGQTKPFAAFHKNNANRDGHCTICKACISAKMKTTYYETRPPTVRDVADVLAETRLLKQGIDRDSLAQRIEAGEYLTDIAAKTTIPYSTLTQLCYRWGIRRGSSSQPIPDSLFVPPLDPGYSWLLGLLMTDGTIGDDGRLRLQIDDEDGVRLAHQLIGLGTVRPKPRNDGGHHVGWEYSVGARQLTDRLAGLGVTPRKTFTLQFPSTDILSLPDFVRGLWDGDGGWGIDRRDGALRTTFGGASMVFVDTLLDILTTVTERRAKAIQRGSQNFWQFWYQGTRAVTLAHWLYQGNPTYCLARKKALVAPYLDVT